MSIYDDRVAQFGVTPFALLMSGSRQYLYAQTHIPEGATVLDVGAGLLKLEEYLVNPASYKPIDSCSAVCNALAYEYCDVMNYDGDPVDYVCCFGVLDTVPHEQIQAFATKLKSLATVAVLFSKACPTGNLIDNSVWHQYTNQQITDAFGACTFEESIHSMCMVRCDV